MRIEAIALDRVQIPFKTPVQHARSARATTDAIIVTIRADDGRSGYGEILPRTYVTGESVEAAFEKLAPALADRLIGRRFSNREEVLAWLLSELDAAGRNLASFSGFELALVDLAGQTFGFAAGEVLGKDDGPTLPAGIVIGFEIPTEKLARHCAILRLKKNPHIKVKVGLPEDPARLSIIADVFGPDVPLRLDANGTWSTAEAIARLKALTAFPIASIEQPVAAGDIEGLRRIREDTGVPVMADESVCTLDDADRLIEARAADIFNVRLGKCGGFLGSRRIVERARENGLHCNLGTLVGETGILSRASEVFGRFVPGFSCLDGKGQNRSLLEADIVEDPTLSAGPFTPGLGIEISEPRLRTHRIEGKLIEKEEMTSER